MKLTEKNTLPLIIFSLLVVVLRENVEAKGGTILYPWGPRNQDHSFNTRFPEEGPITPELGGEEHSLSLAVNLTLGNFKFFNNVYNSLSINKQGIVYFTTGHGDYNAFYRYLHPYHIKELGEKYPAIMPLLGEVDPILGHLFYRETTNKDILQWAAKDVKAAFPSLKQINIDWAIVVTWIENEFWEPEYYRKMENCKCTKRMNSFQAVLTKSGARSFVIFNYEKLEWARNPWPGWAITNYLTGQCTEVVAGITSRDNMSSVAGFIFGENTAKEPFLLPGSQTDRVTNLTNLSNLMSDEGDVGSESGKWVFRVDSNLYSTNSCNYASEEVEQIKIYPSFVNQLGHIPLKIKGPSLINARNIECRFHEDVLTGVHFSNGTVVKRTTMTTGEVIIAKYPPYVLCRLPMLATSNGRVKVELAFTNQYINTDGVEIREDKLYQGSIYSHPPYQTRWDSIYFNFSSSGDPVFSWDPNYFQSHVKGNKPLSSLVLQLTLVTLDFSNPDVGKASAETSLTNTPFNTGSTTWSLGNSWLFDNPKAGYLAQLGVSRDGVYHIDERSYLYSPIVYRNNAVSRDQYAKLCNDWYNSVRGIPDGIRICPPLLEQAELDGNFQQEGEPGRSYWNGETIEPYMTVFRESVPNSEGNCQRCMYNRDNGKLLYDFPSAATAFLKCPDGGAGYIAHQLADVLPRHLCYSSETTTSMRNYYSKRQITAPSSGAGYTAPKLSTWRGDPHITTFDNANFTFNAIGTFWLMKTLREEVPSPFQVQGRMGHFRLWNGSVFTAIAITGKEPLTEVQISLGVTGLRVWLNRAEVEVDTIPKTMGTWGPRPILLHSNGTSVTMHRGNHSVWDIEKVSVTITSGSNNKGDSISFEVFSVEDGFALNIASQLSTSLRGKAGLLGDFDGNTSDFATTTSSTSHPIIKILNLLATLQHILFCHPCPSLSINHSFKSKHLIENSAYF